MEDLSSIRFEQAVSVVFRQEGLFTNNAADPGGATNYGISLRFLKAAGVDINADGVIDVHDIKSLTVDGAKSIYKKYWWDKYNISLIDSLEIATKIFSLGVNMGMHEAVKLLQIAYNRLNKKPIAVDGIMGKQTFDAINGRLTATSKDVLLEEFKNSAKHFYINLVADHPYLNVFLKGWLNRASS